MGHDVAVLMCIKVLNRQALHASEHFLTELIEVALRHERHDLCLEYGKDQGKSIQNYKDSKVLEDLGARGIPVAGLDPVLYGLDYLSQHKVRDRLYYRSEKHAEHSYGSHYRIVPEEHLQRSFKSAEALIITV